MRSSEVKEISQPFPQRQQGSDAGVPAPAARSSAAGVPASATQTPAVLNISLCNEKCLLIIDDEDIDSP